MKWLASGLLALAVLMASGCDELTGRSSVAVIDLDQVARALGRDEVIAQQINQATQQLSTQLTEVARTLQQELQEERGRYEVVGDEAEKELEEKTAAANVRLQQTQQLAQQRAAEFRQAVINNFRAEVQPFASEAAKARGAKAVITVATPMIWYDSSVDITQDVIAKMREAGLQNSGAASGNGGNAPSNGTASDSEAASG